MLEKLIFLKQNLSPHPALVGQISVRQLRRQLEFQGTDFSNWATVKKIFWGYTLGVRVIFEPLKPPETRMFEHFFRLRPEVYFPQYVLKTSLSRH
jgi:hypothetical protein